MTRFFVLSFHGVMKGKFLIAAALFFAAAGISALLLQERIAASLKSSGYLEYTPDEAVALAYGKCGGCHNTAKITNYCFRCGPPFIVVVHNMKTLIALEKGKPGREHLKQLSDTEAVTIVQVWNALIGNWEEGWRKEDLVKMLQNDKPLIDLLNLSPAERPVEKALYGRKVTGADPRGIDGSLPEGGVSAPGETTK